MDKFKRLNRELVHQGSIVGFYKDTIQVPNGNIATWDFLKHRGAAAVLPVMEDGSLLLVRQYRNALDDYVLEIPAGGFENNGETEAEAAGRELEEETGYICDRLEPLLTMYTTLAYCDEKISIFLARSLKQGQKKPDEDEFITLEKYSLDEVLEMIYSGVIQDSKTIASVLAYANKYCNT